MLGALDRLPSTNAPKSLSKFCSSAPTKIPQPIWGILVGVSRMPLTRRASTASGS